jgi:hypothetical protein
MTVSKAEKISSNRSFGLLFFVVFLLIALWPLKSGEDLRIWAFVLSLIFLILGVLNSKLLYPANKLWNYLGILLGKIIAPFVMGIVFFLVVSPIGFIMRLLGKDLLKLKTNKNIESYWIKKEETKSTMKNQF